MLVRVVFSHRLCRAVAYMARMQKSPEVRSHSLHRSLSVSAGAVFCVVAGSLAIGCFASLLPLRPGYIPQTTCQSQGSFQSVIQSVSAAHSRSVFYVAIAPPCSLVANFEPCQAFRPCECPKPRLDQRLGILRRATWVLPLAGRLILALLWDLSFVFWGFDARKNFGSVGCLPSCLYAKDSFCWLR